MLNYIRQSIIKLKLISSEQEVREKLVEYLSYLDQDLEIEILDELIFLILSCFSHFFNLTKDFFKDILDHSRMNSNRIICSSFIFEYMANEMHIQLPNESSSFISDSFHQILAQVDKLNNEKFIIFGHEMAPFDKYHFIYNIIMVVDLKKVKIADYYSIIDSVKENYLIEEFANFIQKIIRSNLATTIPESLLTYNDYFPDLTMDDWSVIIPRLSEQVFTTILPTIEIKFDNKDWNHNFSAAILDKIVKFHIEFSSINKLLNKITPIDMKKDVWQYLADFNVILPKALANKIDSFPDHCSALKIMPDVKKLPYEVFKFGMLSFPSFKTLKRVFKTDIVYTNDVFSLTEFWGHLVFTASNEKCPNELIDKLAALFINYITKDRVIEVLEAMVFNDYLKSDDINAFLIDLFYKLNDYYYDNMKLLFEKILEKKSIQLPSFWELFDFDYICTFDQIDTTNPLLLFAYEFSCENSFFPELTEITILSQKDHSNDDFIIYLLNHENFDCLIEMNEQVLSLAITAYIFLWNNIKPKINGMTKELILPFFAICFIYFSENENHLLFTSPELSSKFQNALKSLSRNNSPLLIKSIDIILYKCFILFNENLFPKEMTISIFNILIPLLYNKLYRANELILLSVIFDLSFQESMKDEVHDIFANHGIKLIKYVIKNMEKIGGFDELMNHKLNLEIFDLEQIKEFLINTIQNDSLNNEIRNTIYFIEYFCQNIPQITITNPSYLNKLLRESIESKNWNDFQIIGQFMYKNNMKTQLRKYADEPIPFLVKKQVFRRIPIEINEIISAIMEYNQPEYLFEPFECLFKKLLRDPSIATNYFIFLFDKIVKSNSISPSLLLQSFSNFYKSHKNEFIKAIKIVFTYDPTSNTFIRNPSFVRPPPSKIGISLISDLIEKTKDDRTKYQAFICLYNLASSFPFLFNKSIFNIILPFLSYFSLLFTVNDTSNEKEETIINIKTSIAAFLMIYKCLYSIELLNEFVPWLFENIITFDESQIIAFTCILNSLFETKKIQKVMLSLAIKYDFLGISNKLLNKNVNQNISLFYHYNIYLNIHDLYLIFNELSVIRCVLIDELANLNDQFQILFNPRSSLLPNYIYQHYPFEFSNSIKNIFDNIDQDKYFFLTSEDFTNHKTEPSLSEISIFLKNFKKHQKNISDFNRSNKLPTIDFILTTSVIRYLAAQPHWIQRYIFKEKKFTVLPKHETILSNVIQYLNSINEKQNDNVIIYNIAFNDYLSNRIINDELIKTIIKILLIDGSIIHEDLFSILIYVIQDIAENKTSLICLLKQLNDFLVIENNNIINYDILFQIIDSINNDDFSNNFGVICGENFVKLALYSENRNNIKFLSYVIYTLDNYNSFIPSSIVTLIGLLMTKIDTIEFIQQALDFCEVVGEKRLENAMPTILFAFNYALSNNSIKLITRFLQVIPSLGNYKKDSLMKIYAKSIRSYINHGNNDEADLICSIINSLAPEKNTDYMTNLNENDFSQESSQEDSCISDFEFVINQASYNLISSDRDFWNLYQMGRLTINSILIEDISKLNEMRFLFNFPGLLDFQTRMNYFKEQMSFKINENKMIELNVNRCNILADSFEQLHKLEPYELLRKIKVKFIGEKGIDEGGLTCEWFTLLVKEIFNSNNKLFNMTDNKSYHPNISSYENEQHIELFKFAGMIIARSLIQDQCINAHLTQSFCRQILNLPFKFKDLEDFDHEIYTSLNHILNNDVNQLNLDFTLNAKKNNSVEMILLKENGDEINVTNENKKEFVNLYAEYHLKNSIIDQIKSFCEGFNSLIPQEQINYFSPAELDLLICGIPEINIDDLRENTEYELPYDDHHPVIELFYNVISEWDNDNLAKLLLFITGSSQVPVNGFIEYKSKGKPIKIMPGGDKKNYCVAHTCFNILALPGYETEKEMNEKLLISIQQGQFELL